MPAAPGHQQVPPSPEVFISYSRKDKEFVRRLDEALKTRDREAWVDWEDIRPTEEWMQAIYGAIEGADTFVFVLTPDSVASVVCGREIAHAAAHNKRMVPIVARDVNVDTAPEALAKLNWIFFRESDDFDEATDKLISALDTDLEWVHAHTDLLTQAIKWEANSKNNSLVLRGEALKAAEQWLAQAGANKEPKPTALQTQYIGASRKAATRRQLFTLGALTFGLLVAIVLAVMVFFSQTKATKQTRFAAAAKKETDETASHGNVLVASRLVESEKNAQALAQLAKALRLNPENREASGFALALLRQLSWCVPLTGSMPQNGGISSAQFSPDGQRVVTASTDNTARVWDASSGKPIGEPMKHELPVNSAQFNMDGRRVVTASNDKTARVWDASSGKPVGEPMKHEDRVNSARFSSDGQWVVTASADGTARVWDAASGKPVGKPMQHGGLTFGGVLSAQFSPDGRQVVTGSADMTARVWDAASGRPIGEPMKHENGVVSAQFSPDGQRVVTASVDGTARLWDAANSKPIGEIMKHESGVSSAQFSPDDQRVVTASADTTARVWDATSGKPISEPMKHENWVSSAQFSPDGRRIVTVSLDHKVRVWDVANSRPIEQPPMMHEDWVTSAEFSPDGKRVVTASQDNTARVWDAASGKPVGEPMKHGLSVNPAQLSGDMATVWNIARSKFAAQFSPNSQRVVTASWDGTAQMWDATSGKPIGQPMKDENGLLSAQFSPDGQRIVTASWGKTARVWDAVSGKPVGAPMKHEQVVWSARFSPNSQWVVTASYDTTARVWDAATGKPIGAPMKHEAYVNSARFNINSQRVVTASWDMTARVWEAASGKPIGQPMKHESGVLSAQFSPDGQRIVTASADMTARLWETASGRSIGQPMKHEGAVFSAHFSPDGQRVVTASADKTARVWDAASGRPVSERLTHEGEVLSAQFSPDGNRVVTASKDGTARVWDAVSVTDKDTREDILLLTELAEVTAAATWEPAGQGENVHLLSPDQVLASRKKIAEKYARMSSGPTPLERFLKWSVSDARSRTISPFSQVTIAEWLENTIKEGAVEGLRAAMQVDPANARVTAYLGRCLADQALKPASDPDEARRARGEADFLTSRALKLAPDNDEVKKLRDEVVKLLELKTD
jgi:WD40 repeat protein